MIPGIDLETRTEPYFCLVRVEFVGSQGGKGKGETLK
jgi:hypothetical protein